nr:MAG TPA: hypothetical protein [Caudoviricetes sp.]
MSVHWSDRRYRSIWIYGVHSVCVIYFRYRIKIAR